MQTIGNYLKSGREARNIRLSEVARSTKISKWYLDCLEKDEFDKIPGGPYIKGYIASYASFIGIEEDEILKRYDSLQISSADDNEISDHLPQDKKRQKLRGVSFSKKRLLILSMVVLVALAFGLNHFFFQNQPHIAAQLSNEQDLNIQSAPASQLKPVETPLAPHDNSGQSPELKSSAKNNETESQNKMEGQDIHFPKTTDKAPAIRKVPSSSEKKDLKGPVLSQAKNTLAQDTTETTNRQLEATPGFQTPDAQSQAVNNLRVINAVVAGNILNKNPAELLDTFHWSMEKVYIWTMIECEQPPSSIRHTYYFKGQKVNDIVLKIKSPRWRTWSYKTLLEKRWIGQWRVDITSEEGKLLQSVFFEVN
jgi:cytoskeletal protein RodZ